MEFGIGWGGDLGSLVLWQNDLTNVTWGRKGFWLTLPHHGSSLKEVRTGLEQGRLEGRVDSLSALSRDSQVPMLLCLVSVAPPSVSLRAAHPPSVFTAVSIPLSGPLTCVT